MSSHSAKIYINKLPNDIKESEIKDEFREFGKIRDIIIKRGYAFLEYEDASDAD